MSAGIATRLTTPRFIRKSGSFYDTTTLIFSQLGEYRVVAVPDDLLTQSLRVEIAPNATLHRFCLASSEPTSIFTFVKSHVNTPALRCGTYRFRAFVLYPCMQNICSHIADALAPLVPFAAHRCRRLHIPAIRDTTLCLRIEHAGSYYPD